MTKLYKNKYRIKSARLPSWDYGANGAYFVTICTKDHAHYFGTIADGFLAMSRIGQIANTFWQEIPDHFPFVILDLHVIMPNHLHSILVFAKDDVGSTVETHNCASQGVDGLPRSGTQPETHNYASLPLPGEYNGNRFGPQSQNLSSVIRAFKSSVKRYANENGISFLWQPRFHEHIIRSETSLGRIREYIVNNSAKWQEDKYYSPSPNELTPS